ERADIDRLVDKEAARFRVASIGQAQVRLLQNAGAVAGQTGSQAEAFGIVEDERRPCAGAVWRRPARADGDAFVTASFAASASARRAKGCPRHSALRIADLICLRFDDGALRQHERAGVER